MNHTPGPWEVHRTGYTGRSSAKYVINGQPSKPGNAYRAVAHIKHSTVSPMEANARLIAAAPELLEALQEMYHAFNWGDMNQVETWAIEQCRAAIAKATGEK